MMSTTQLQWHAIQTLMGTFHHSGQGRFSIARKGGYSRLLEYGIPVGTRGTVTQCKQQAQDIIDSEEVVAFHAAATINLSPAAIEPVDHVAEVSLSLTPTPAVAEPPMAFA